VLSVVVLASCGASHSAADSRVIDRAVAAMGSGPILHIVWESPTGNSFINLRTGARTASFEREELWTDRQAHRVHLLLSDGGRVIGDELLPQDASRRKNGALPDPGSSYAAEWLSYPAALKTGVFVGRGKVQGHRVDWLRFKSSQLRSGERVTREIAVGADSYSPVLFRASFSGNHSHTHFDQRILVAKAMPYSSADFEREGPVLNTQGNGNSEPGSGGWSSSGTSATITNPPATGVHAPFLTAGATAGGLKLGGVNRLSASKRINGKKEKVHGVEIVYGPMLHGLVAGDLSTTVDELPKPDNSTDWRAIPNGSIETQVSEESGFSQSVSDPKGRTTHEKLWTGNLEKGGFYITINTYKGMAALLAIARSLHRAAQ
jgi:hypothetical protein